MIATYSKPHRSFDKIIMKLCICTLLFTIAVLTDAQVNPDDTGNYCDAGFFNNGNFCQRCPPLSVSKPGSFFCTPCPPGLYVPETVDFESSHEYYPSECSVCSAGYYINGTRCIPCPIGSFSTAVNSTACIRCPNGQYTGSTASTSKKACFSCPPGSILYADLGWSCEPCGDGAYQDQPNQLECKPCPRGTSSNLFKQETVDDCEPCPAGTYSPKELGYMQNRKCIGCPKGYYSPRRGAYNCTKCPRGTKANPDRTACIVTNPPQSDIQTCPPGTGRRVFGMPCTRCPKGTATASSSVTECIHCVDDLVAAPDASSCKCPDKLLYNRVNGRNVCVSCPGGFEPLDDRSCPCPKDKYFVLMDSSSECRCKPFMKEAKNGSCVACDPSGLPDYLARYRCNLCQPGDRFSRRLNRCIPCPLGFTSESKDKKCSPCKITYIDKKRRTRCGCRPGEVLKKDRCVPCPRGQFYDRSTELCESCPAGQFASVSGQVRCKRCPEGQRYGYEGSKTCPPKCPSNGIIRYGNCYCGEYSILVRKKADLTCKRCPDGKVSYDSKSCSCQSGSIPLNGSCAQCPSGTVSYRGGRKCYECGAGRIPREDQSECVDCPQGTFTLVPRSTKCYSCKPGTFHTISGKCGRCKPGFRVRKGRCVACDNSVSDGGDVSFCQPCTNGTKPAPDRAICI